MSDKIEVFAHHRDLLAMTLNLGDGSPVVIVTAKMAAFLRENGVTSGFVSIDEARTKDEFADVSNEWDKLNAKLDEAAAKSKVAEDLGNVSVRDGWEKVDRFEFFTMDRAACPAEPYEDANPRFLRFDLQVPDHPASARKRKRKR